MIRTVFYLTTIALVFIVCGCRISSTVKTKSAKGDLRLVSAGANEYVIVQADKPSEAEKFSATELADFIKRSTGVELKTVKEAEFKGLRGIYVGQTRFAQKRGVFFNKMGQEEWFICAVGGLPKAFLCPMMCHCRTRRPMTFML